MEETNKALVDLTAAISAMSAQVSEIHPMVLELQGWRPAIERSVEDLCAEVGELRQHLKETRPAPALAQDPAPAREKDPVQPVRLTDLPPLLPATVELPPLRAQITDAHLPRPSDHLLARGGDGHGPTGHGRTSDYRGMSPG